MLPQTTYKSRTNRIAGTCRTAATAYQTTTEFQLAAMPAKPDIIWASEPKRF
jgi:hypothetical protein